MTAKPKKRIAYIAGQPIAETSRPWGGSTATNYCFQKAFENDDEFQLDLLPRDKCGNADVIRSFCRGADIVHLDDTRIGAMMYEAGLQPDVIGPITRSPAKNYKGWTCPYSADWFYGARVIRLNCQEERKNPEDITLITHGIDSERLRPNWNTQKKLILWAGQAKRHAKNYALWQEIQKNPPPPGYEYKTMTDYNVEDYWQALDGVAVLINTSLYESFCCAAFEAMAKGVPVIWKKQLQSGVHENAGIRVDYTVEAYRRAICVVLKQQAESATRARQYVENHVTLKHMRDSYSRIYREVLNAKAV